MAVTLTHSYMLLYAASNVLLPIIPVDYSLVHLTKMNQVLCSIEPLIRNPVNRNSIFDRQTAEYFPKTPYQACQVSLCFFFLFNISNSGFPTSISDFFQFNVCDVC